jgi:hypothetical protein
MQSFPDEFETLPFSEQFLLWSVRQWMKTQRSGLNTMDLLCEPFERIGAPKSHYALDGFMTILNMCCETQVTIQCTCRNSINADENHILNIFAALQTGGNGDEAVSLLRAWLPAAAMRWAMDHGQQLVDGLAGAGHILRPHILGQASVVQPQLSQRHGEAPQFLN